MGSHQRHVASLFLGWVHSATIGGKTNQKFKCTWPYHSCENGTTHATYVTKLDLFWKECEKKSALFKKNMTKQNTSIFMRIALVLCDYDNASSNPK